MRLPAKRILWVALLLVISASATAQTSEDLFDNSILQEIRLTVNPADWEQFKANSMANDYYPADLTWRGIAVENIGIRHRGTSSRSGTKPYLGLKFDQYVKGQRFLGLSNLRLKNAINDPSFLHEILAMDLFRRMGLPAPRESYARLYINEGYSGLYWVVEEIDTTFLDRVFGEHEGCLYNYNWVGEYHFEYLGDDPALYAPDRFEPKSCPANTDPAALVEMIRAMNLSPDDAFVAEVSGFLDLNPFLRFVAVDQFLANWDGVLGWLGMNNFYLYRFAGTTRFQFIAWDKDGTLSDSQLSVWWHTDENVLTRRLFQSPELRAAYQDALQKTAMEAGVAGGWLDQEMDRFYAQIQESALADPLKPASNAEFDGAVEEVREFVRQRSHLVIAQIGPAPPPAVARGGVMNGASFRQPVAAGSIASVFGANLGYADLTASVVPLPETLDQTTVQVNGIAVPLFSVSPDQINFQIPWELAGTSQASVTVTVGGAVSSPQTVNLTTMAPALFSVNQKGSGQGVILIAGAGEMAAPSGSIRGCAARPVRRGESISIYGTGWGPVSNQPATGERASGDTLSTTTSVPVVTVGGAQALVTFSGLAPDSIGVYRLDAQVPENAPSGNAVPVVLAIGGVSSNTVSVAIQ